MIATNTTRIDPDAPLDGALAGKVAIVTGASRGIGAVSAREFARAGAAVVLAARDEHAITAIALEIQGAGGQAHPVRTDAGDPASVRNLIRESVDRFGRLDVAFNNAGDAHPPARLADITLEDFDRCIRVNLGGVFLAMKYEIAVMLDGGGGAIVNMSSSAGVNGVPGMGAYAASKHGVIGLTRTAAIEENHMSATAPRTNKPNSNQGARNRTGSGAGPPLLLLVGIFAALFLASVVGVGVATAGAHFPSPFDPIGTLSAYLGSHHSALQVSALLQFGSAIPLAIFTAAVVARLHHLGIRAPGATITLVGGGRFQPVDAPARAGVCRCRDRGDRRAIDPQPPRRQCRDPLADRQVRRHRLAHRRRRITTPHPPRPLARDRTERLWRRKPHHEDHDRRALMIDTSGTQRGVHQQGTRTADPGTATGLFEQFGIFEQGNGRRYLLTALRELLLSVGISIFGTVVVYFLLSPHFPSASIIPLVGALLVPTAANLISIVRRRRLDVFGVLVVIGLLVTLVAALLGGGQRVLLLRETLLTGAIGLACLLSLPLPQPAGYYFSRQLITGNDPAKQPGFQRLWADRRFRRTVRQLNGFWGLVLFGEFALQVVMVLTLPVTVVLATGSIVVAAPRIAALAVTFIVGRRVSQRMRNETAPKSALEPGVL
ncbi:MAG: SDR family NAD(P)-dependent oxidoreductase [Pseudonocardiaceae bacterium]